jgi:hypothetical protein
MEPKTRPSFNDIVIENAELAEVNPLRIIVSRKTKRVVGVQPTVIGVPTGVGFMYYSVHILNFSLNKYIRLLYIQ